jgi:alanine dehydrogenase
MLTIEQPERTSPTPTARLPPMLGGVPGVAPGGVAILGGGVAGTNAATMAIGLQADVTILDKSIPRLRWLNDHFQGALAS